MKNKYENFGYHVGAALQGRDSSAVRHALGQAAVMESPAAASFNRELCKIACAAYEADDEGHTAPAILFRNLSVVDKWESSYNRFTDCVKSALSKQAMVRAGLAVHEGLGGPMMKTLLSAGVLGGAGVGSLGFLLSRNAEQTSSENATLLEKVRAYKQLKRDIQEDMNAKDIMTSGVSQVGKGRYNV